MWTPTNALTGTTLRRAGLDVAIQGSTRFRVQTMAFSDKIKQLPAVTRLVALQVLGAADRLLVKNEKTRHVT